MNTETISAYNDMWTEEQSIQLIREYRARPILWDPKCKLFYQKALKPKAWEEIGEVLNYRPESCRHKMTVLLSSFRREKAKIMHSIKDGDPCKMYISTWFGFKEMSFLMDKEGERKRLMNQEESNENKSYESVPRRSVSTYQYEPTPPKKHCPNPPVSHEVIHNSELAVSSNRATQVMQETPPEPQPGPSNNIIDNEDEIKSFTNFIATKMRKYSETTKNEVQRAICEVIFKADSSCLERNTNRKESVEHQEIQSSSRPQQIDDTTVIADIKEEEEDDLSETEFYVIEQ